MFGAYARAALAIPLAVLVDGILDFIGPAFLPLLGSEGAPLYEGFSALIENSLLIMLVAIAAGVLARAVVESNPRGA